MLRPQILILTTLIAASLAIAQGTPAPSTKPVADPAYGLAFFESQVGSFKLLPGGEVSAQGKLEFSGNGTFLVSRLQKGGTVTTTGTIKMEHNDVKANKQVYFGRGSVVIQGKFGAVQFFGKEIKAKFNGFGFVRLYGEFDKNLNTGEYWYEGDKHRAWGNSGMSFVVPNPDSVTAPTVKKVGN